MLNLLIGPIANLAGTWLDGKVEKTKATNTAKIRNHQENKEMPNLEYQGMRKSAMIEADESLVPESSEEEEEAAERIISEKPVSRESRFAHIKHK